MLANVVGWFGPRPVAPRVLPIAFGRTFLTDPARAGERAAWRAHLPGNRRAIWRATMGVVDLAGAADELPRIAAPTLVVRGAGRSSSVERPERVTAALAPFLEGLTES